MTCPNCLNYIITETRLHNTIITHSVAACLFPIWLVKKKIIFLKSCNAQFYVAVYVCYHIAPMNSKIQRIIAQTVKFT